MTNKKFRNVKTILLLIVICLYSCTPGKLIGDKHGQFPFNHNFYDSVRNSIQGVILPVMPTNMGSYTVVATINDKHYFGSTEKDIIFLNVCVFGGFAIICLFLFFYKQRDEVITLPDEYNENY